MKTISTLVAVVLLLATLQTTTANSPYSNPHFVGNRSVIVHLMQWKFDDIAAECDRFLGPYGYGGVQLSPVNEHAVLDRRPWYELYQPVSYRIQSRSGNEAQFKSMVARCNHAGVRIYVDVVLNHMTGGQSGHGTAGSHYDGNTLQYPGVPFGPNDFHGHESCHTADLEIHNYDNPEEARNCRLSGLRDLKQSSDYVRSKQIDFLNNLVKLGVAGFRSDASKHQWPGDLEAIYSKVHNLNTEFFPPNSRPFIYHEVIYYGGNGIGSSEYTKLGRAIEFHYYKELAGVVRNHNQAKYLHNFGQPWAMVGSDDALVMVDSHDLQRFHTGSVGTNINYHESHLLKLATAFMLAWPYGVPRVMSSYNWPQKVEGDHDVNDWMGPPSDPSGGILTVHPNPDLTCNKEWICEHRWRQIYNMVGFRNIAANEPVANWWDNGDYQIAFSRGHKAFVVFNMAHGQRLSHKFQTGLPAGTYCDLVSGNLEKGKCTGASVTVEHNGETTITIEANKEDPFVAIHIGAKH